MQWKDWLDRNVLDLGRQMRLSYLPPLMVYMAAGISGLTDIVGTFFVKEYLGLSAEFLAALGFWMMLPWTLKMPLGHLVDLIWRHKSGLIILGAGLLSASVLIMIGLIGSPDAMRELLPIETWFVLSALLGPIGYVIQDTVADAMTVEAVPRVDSKGKPVDEKQLRLAHTTMQTLGRVAIIGGTVLVAAVNVYLFSGVESLSQLEKAAVYLQIYRLALIIPVVSVLGVALAAIFRWRDAQRLAAQGFELDQIERLLGRPLDELPEANWWILGGGLAFVVFSAGMGLATIPMNEEIIFAGSLAIVLFLLRQLTRDLPERARNELYATAIVIFAFRAIPATGAGSTWWMIDELGFDQQFLSELSLIASVLTLFGMFIFRRFMAERPITYIIAALTIAGAILFLPNIAMFYGLHQWTAAHTGGIVDARFIALIDTALESPLGQIAMIPMLAWIANSAPAKLKATYFAVMAAFTNLALALSKLGTKYLNQVFTITREVRDSTTGTVEIPADYSELGALFITVTIVGTAMPIAAIFFVKRTLLAEPKPEPAAQLERY
ncbi:major facilitator superfamily permease [Methylocaldum marinum]|uniref:Major facilitator superfamily permease n=1 Tax=Methylocaldum marinum TaxID=1432792 RepID=A0A286P403_9GAMM|nr:hypothetical protein [Methylocaldum marinum]BBA32375.1 major facilitator superfamily permease [Methylocaldum marinum]